MNKKSTVTVFGILIAITLFVMAGLSGCSAANTASQNVSTAADNFEVMRRIVLYNGITDKEVQVVEGRCSLGNFDSPGELSITCKVGPNDFIKDYWGLSDNITYFAEQLGTAKADDFHYRVIFRPETLIPDLQLSTSDRP
jgi:hypothetical protein